MAESKGRIFEPAVKFPRIKVKEPEFQNYSHCAWAANFNLIEAFIDESLETGNLGDDYMLNCCVVE